MFKDEWIPPRARKNLIKVSVQDSVGPLHKNRNVDQHLFVTNLKSFFSFQLNIMMEASVYKKDIVNALSPGILASSPSLLG